MATVIISEIVESTQYSTPAAAGTVTLTREQRVFALLNPAGTLATLTIAMPTSPLDGDEVVISSTQIITALTMSNGTLVGTLTSLAVGGFAKFRYNSTTSSWFRIG